MSTSRVAKIFGGTGIGAMAGSVVGAAVGAATGAVSGATGAAIMNAANYTGYVVAEAATTVATGNAVLSGAVGLLTGGCVGGIFGTGIFKHASSVHKSKATQGTGIVGYIAGQTLGGVVGYAIFMHAATSTMSLKTIAISSAVGSAVTAIPITCGLLCCLGLTAGCVALCVSGVVLAKDGIHDKRDDVKKQIDALFIDVKSTVKDAAAEEPEESGESDREESSPSSSEENEIPQKIIEAKVTVVQGESDGSVSTPSLTEKEQPQEVIVSVVSGNTNEEVVYQQESIGFSKKDNVAEQDATPVNMAENTNDTDVEAGRSLRLSRMR